MTVKAGYDELVKYSINRLQELGAEFVCLSEMKLIL